MYVSKKTERIVAAIFVVIDLIKDNPDFIKVIHDQALVASARPIVFAGMDSVDARTRILERQSDLMVLASLLRVGGLSGRLSVANVQTIQAEISQLIDYCEELLGQLVVDLPFAKTAFQPRLERYLSEDFFAVTKPQKNNQILSGERNGETEKEATKEANASSLNRELEVTETDRKIASVAPVGSPTKASPAVGRTAKIIGLLARLGEANIKDIANEFPGVSEKTIQRDMARLIEENKVRTEGKRRWTKYFLN